MFRWALLVVALYGLLLVVLTLLLLSVASNWPLNPLNLLGVWEYWAFIFVQLLCQAALLLVPVRHSRARPTSRISLLPALIGAGLLMGILALGASLALLGLVRGDEAWNSPAEAWGPLVVGGLVWFGWSVMFFRLSRRDPLDVVSRQCRMLLKASILELLVAVPTHVVVRHRDYCCAGFLTFVGLVAGISVMLASFGPGVYFLFLDRWKQLHPWQSKGD